MDEKKQNKTGIMILLAMIAAMGFLAATEGWLRVSECGEVLPGELPPSAVEETGDWDTGSVNEYPGIIRFHVIANSDKQEDQQIKYMVRDEVFRNLENALTRKLLQDEARVSAEAAEPAAKKESAAKHLPRPDCQKTSLRKNCQENAAFLTFNPGIAGFAGKWKKIERFSYFAALQAALARGRAVSNELADFL